MTPFSLDRLTSIGRPIDPAYATNRAVLWLMPAAGAVAAFVQGVQGDGGPIAAGTAALVAAAVVFGGWALTRELAPDDSPAAFVSAGLGFVTALVVGAPSLLLLFVTLLLARVVNRTVGLPARVTDSLAVAGLTVWAMASLVSPLVGVVGALAFAADALLNDGRKRQLIFAAACLAGTGVALLRHGLGPADAGPLTTGQVWLVAGVGAAYATAIVRTRRVASVGDATGAPLSLSRVRAGMLIGLLVAFQALTAGSAGLEDASLVWASLAGVALGYAGKRMRRAAARQP